MHYFIIQNNPHHLQHLTKQHYCTTTARCYRCWLRWCFCCCCRLGWWSCCCCWQTVAHAEVTFGVCCIFPWETKLPNRVHSLLAVVGFVSVTIHCLFSVWINLDWKCPNMSCIHLPSASLQWQDQCQGRRRSRGPECRRWRRRMWEQIAICESESGKIWKSIRELWGWMSRNILSYNDV